MARGDLIFTILGIDRASKAFKQVEQAADSTAARLSSFGKIGAKTLAGFPLAAAAAGTGVAAGLAGVAVAVGAAGAAMLHNQEQVAKAASDLWADFSSDAKAAVAPLADDVTKSLNTVHAALKDLSPQMREMFASAGPAIEHFTNGVVLLARNAMPGFVTAVKTSEPALRGLESFLENVGIGITRFFTNLSKGAESSGQIFGSVGRIVRDFAGFAGSALAELSNSGAPAVGVLEGFLRKLEETLLALAHGAFPGLAAAASGFLGVGSGILTILNALAPVLGPLIGQLGSFAVALKLVDLVSFGGVSAGLAVVKDAIGQAEGAAGKLKAGVSALGSSGLGPLAVVAAGLTVILGGLGEEQQRAAKDAAAHESRIQSLTDALRQSGGAIDANVKSLAAKSLSEQKVARTGKTVLEIAREAGVSLSTLTDAYLGNADAVKIVNDQLDAYLKAAAAGRESDALGGTGEDPVSQRVRDLKEMLPGLNSEYATSAQRVKDLAEASGSVAKKMAELTPAQQAAKAEAEKLKESFKTLQDPMKGVAEKGQAILDILNKLTGKQPDLREATQAWNDLMRSLTKDTDWDSTVDGVQKLKDGLVDAKGEINTTTEAGSKLQDWAQQASVDFANTGVALKNAGTPADEMNKKLGVLRQQFIDNAVAQGLGKEAAERLANAYNLVPDNVTTLVITPNLAQKMQEMGLFATQIHNLPNGTVIVTANPSSAYANVTKLIQDINGRTATIRVTASGTSREVVRNAAGGMPAASKGGWISGPGTSTSDSIPTMLSNKEFVVNADDAARNAAVLESINAGRSISGLAPAGAPTGSYSQPGSAQPQKVVIEFRGEFWESIKRYVKVSAGGNVQKAFGQ